MNIRTHLQETLQLHVQVCESRLITSEGNNLLSTVCSDPQALLSPQWKWNWHSLYLSCRGPPLSAAPEESQDMQSIVLHCTTDFLLESKSVDQSNAR